MKCVTCHDNKKRKKTTMQDQIRSFTGFQVRIQLTFLAKEFRDHDWYSESFNSNID